MIKCIMDKLCEMLALLEEKLLQLSEVTNQQDLLCEKLEVLLDEDAECPECDPVEHVWEVFAFDEANGIFDPEYVHTSTVNGTAFSNPFSAGWVNKSEAYETTTDAVNALPGHSMTVVGDIALTANGKVEYRLVVPVGETLTIVNTHTGDVYSFSTAEDGSCVGTVVDSGGAAITSYTPVEL